MGARQGCGGAAVCNAPVGAHSLSNMDSARGSLKRTEPAASPTGGCHCRSMGRPVPSEQERPPSISASTRVIHEWTGRNRHTDMGSHNPTAAPGESAPRHGTAASAPAGPVAIHPGAGNLTKTLPSRSSSRSPPALALPISLPCSQAQERGSVVHTYGRDTPAAPASLLASALVPHTPTHFAAPRPSTAVAARQRRCAGGRRRFLPPAASSPRAPPSPPSSSDTHARKPPFGRIRTPLCGGVLLRGHRCACRTRELRAAPARAPLESPPRPLISPRLCSVNGVVAGRCGRQPGASVCTQKKNRQHGRGRQVRTFFSFIRAGPPSNAASAPIGGVQTLPCIRRP